MFCLIVHRYDNAFVELLITTNCQYEGCGTPVASVVTTDCGRQKMTKSLTNSSWLDHATGQWYRVIDVDAALI